MMTPGARPAPPAGAASPHWHDGGQSFRPRERRNLRRACPVLSLRSRRAFAALAPRLRRACAALSPCSRRARAALAPRSRRARTSLAPRSRRALAARSRFLFARFTHGGRAAAHGQGTLGVFGRYSSTGAVGHALTRIVHARSPPHQFPPQRTRWHRASPLSARSSRSPPWAPRAARSLASTPTPPARSPCGRGTSTSAIAPGA